MPRTTTRTATVPLTLTDPLRQLFGSVENAHRRLGLKTLVSPVDFRRAFTGALVTTEVADVVHDACRAWIRRWANPAEWKGDLSFTIEPGDWGHEV